MIDEEEIPCPWAVQGAPHPQIIKEGQGVWIVTDTYNLYWATRWFRNESSDEDATYWLRNRGFSRGEVLNGKDVRLVAGMR